MQMQGLHRHHHRVGPAADSPKGPIDGPPERWVRMLVSAARYLALGCQTRRTVGACYRTADRIHRIVVTEAESGFQIRQTADRAAHECRWQLRGVRTGAASVDCRQHDLDGGATWHSGRVGRLVRHDDPALDAADDPRE